MTVFGGNVEGELDTPYNGLILHRHIEKAMDDGAIVAVPDIADDPTPDEVEAWEKKEPKNYRWRIIDNDADSRSDRAAKRTQQRQRTEQIYQSQARTTT